jgi:hypothetical protein
MHAHRYKAHGWCLQINILTSVSFHLEGYLVRGIIVTFQDHNIQGGKFPLSLVKIVVQPL